jgi:hypothetical protein
MRLESVAVVVISPADGLGAPFANTVVFTFPRFVWFMMLKTSARNWAEILSVARKFLKSEKSTSAKPGPR